jgi:hypothetical protein
MIMVVMKKTFPFQLPGKDPLRVVEGIKHDVRKYLKRERRKALPEAANTWDFNCKIGPAKETSVSIKVEELMGAIEAAAKNGCTEVYVEILAQPGLRPRKTAQATPTENESRTS